MNDAVSVRDFGAIGDGVTDDFAAFQRALSSGARRVLVPFGVYLISETLRIFSNTSLECDRCARIVMKRSKRCARGDFLLTSDEGGSENVAVIGGIWDGQSRLPEHDKPDLFDKNGYSGALLNFVGVRGLKLSGLVAANSTTYYIRLCRVENFEVSDVDLISDDFGYNQDGVHLGGGVRHGVIRNIRALTRGQTNDDMVALNADDSVERVENLDLVRDDIEDVLIENIYTESCHTIIRMLSVTAAIRNVKMKNIHGGYRCYAINGDGARYCKTPLFTEEEYPDGVGRIENIEIDGFTCYRAEREPDQKCSGMPTECAIKMESNCKNFVIRGFNKLDGAERDAALAMAKVGKSRVIADGVEYKLWGKSDELLLPDFKELKIN